MEDTDPAHAVKTLPPCVACSQMGQVSRFIWSSCHSGSFFPLSFLFCSVQLWHHLGSAPGRLGESSAVDHLRELYSVFWMTANRFYTSTRALLLIDDNEINMHYLQTVLEGLPKLHTANGLQSGIKSEFSVVSHTHTHIMRSHAHRRTRSSKWRTLYPMFFLLVFVNVIIYFF